MELRIRASGEEEPWYMKPVRWLTLGRYYVVRPWDVIMEKEVINQAEYLEELNKVRQMFADKPIKIEVLNASTSEA